MPMCVWARALVCMGRAWRGAARHVGSHGWAAPCWGGGGVARRRTRAPNPPTPAAPDRDEDRAPGPSPTVPGPVTDLLSEHSGDPRGHFGRELREKRTTGEGPPPRPGPRPRDGGVGGSDVLERPCNAGEGRGGALSGRSRHTGPQPPRPTTPPPPPPGAPEATDCRSTTGPPTAPLRKFLFFFPFPSLVQRALPDGRGPGCPQVWGGGGGGGRTPRHPSRVVLNNSASPAAGGGGGLTPPPPPPPS